MKKLILMFCLLSLLILVLTACGETDPTSADDLKTGTTYLTGTQPNCVAAEQKLQLQLPTTMIGGGLGR